MSAHVEELLWEWASGALEAPQAEEVDAHLAQCPACADRAAQAKASQQLLRAIEVPRPPREFWDRVDDKVLAALPRRRRVRWAWLELTWPRAGLAAALTVVIALGAALALRGGSGDGPGQLEWRGDSTHQVPLASGEWLDTGVKTAVARLPEGSRVELSQGTRARFAAASKDQVRVALERGRLTVDATHRQARSFVVVAGEVEVAVVGTRFLVERESGATVVQVFEGQVEVRRGDEVRRVSAGERLRLDAPSPPVQEPLAAPKQGAQQPLTMAEPVPQSQPQPPPQRARVGRGQHSPPDVAGGAVAALEAPPPMAHAAPGNAAAGGAAVAPSPDDWAMPDRFEQPPPVAAATPQKPAVRKTTRKPQPWASKLFGGWNLAKWANVDWLSDVVPPNASEEEYRARQLVFLADANRCEAVEKRARLWLARYSDQGELADGVRFTLARCLKKLGRPEAPAAPAAPGP